MIDRSVVKTWQVLVVDDDADSLEVIRFTLTYHGAEVITASSGKEAVEVLSSLRPSIIFLDLSMPGIDGWDLLKHIRRILHLEHTPVVALTAHAMKGDQERVMDAGFTFYISKPFSPVTFVDDLLAMISANGLSGLLDDQ